MEEYTPRLEIFPARIEANARSVIQACHAQGVQVAGVSKVLGGHPALVQAFASAGAEMIADSRVSNLQAAGVAAGSLPLMLLRIPSPRQALEVVRCSDFSLNSSVETLKRLSEAAQFLKKRHCVIIMLDVGDLREGIWPERAVEVVGSAARLQNLEIAGLGCNLACYGGVVPSVENMQLLVDVRNACREATGLELGLLSGGNSANLPLLAAGKMPREINHLRIGEAIVLGRNVLDRQPWPGTRQDTVRIVAEVLEIERKPSIPVGMRAQDAFGGLAEFVDRGVRTRAICNIGRQDVDISGICPEDPGMIVLGGSSDHLILDIEDTQTRVTLGSEVGFSPDYGALLAAATSAYVRKVVIDE